MEVKPVCLGFLRTFSDAEVDGTVIFVWVLFF